MSVVQDLRLAWRHLRHAPGHALTAALTLALAVGANSAIFSAVHAVLLRPLPVQQPEALAVIWQTDAGGRAVVELTYRHLREWSGHSPLFTRASVMASHNWSGALEGHGEPSRMWFAAVSAGFFETLGVTPLHGRTILPEDDVPNGPGVAVLNYSTWMRRFGGDPAVVGTTMTLDGRPLEVVGVMPPGVDVPRGAELWTPSIPIIVTGTPPSTGNLDTFGVFYVVGRLRPGLDAASARAELDALEMRLNQTHAGPAEVGGACGRHAVRGVRLRAGAAGTLGALGRGRAAPRHRLRQRRRLDDDAGLAAAAGTGGAPRARRYAGRGRPAVGAGDFRSSRSPAACSAWRWRAVSPAASSRLRPTICRGSRTSR